MRSTKATATARLAVVSNPETAAPDRVLRLTVCVPATQENGDEVLKTVLNGFEDTINLIGSDFCQYTCETGDLQTGQTVRVGNQPRRPTITHKEPEEAPEKTFWEKFCEKFGR
jgi:hypothetical protein